jgi:hypothetical protein
MSEALHPTRLMWDGRRGVAAHDGVSVELRRSPTVFAEVHYVPGLQAEVREHASDRRREMTATEIRLAQAFLAHFADRCREGVGQLYAPEQVPA